MESVSTVQIGLVSLDRLGCVGVRNGDPSSLPLEMKGTTEDGLKPRQHFKT